MILPGVLEAPAPNCRETGEQEEEHDGRQGRQERQGKGQEAEDQQAEEGDERQGRQAAEEEALIGGYLTRDQQVSGVAPLGRRPLSPSHPGASPAGSVFSHTRSAVEVCRTLLGIEVAIRKVPGTTVASEATGQPIYTPPVGERLIRDLLANWEEFLQQATDIDPLIRMAVGHYQFEAIHPFTDGIGRTGRILNLLYLVEQGLLDLPVLYLSRYLLANRSDYYRYLRRVTLNADWESWLLYMLSAVTETACWTTDRIHRIHQLADATEELIRQKAPTTHSRELAELIFERPYCRIRNVVDAGIAQRQTASVYLKTLTEIGVLDTYKAGREKIFINQRLMRLLTQEDPGPLTF